MMHDDELVVDTARVRRLVDTQFAAWRDRPLRALPLAGTVSAVFRLGDDLAVRCPLRPDDPDAVRATMAREGDATRAFAEAAGLPTPELVAIGEPDDGFPLPWTVHTWVPGDVGTPSGAADSTAFAEDLAALVLRLRSADTGGRTFAGGGRGGHLPDHDAWVAECLTRSAGLLPVERLAAIWERLRVLPEPDRQAMTHGDLIPANVLVAGDALVGVLDAGGWGPADPALDLVAGWHLLDADARAVFRARVGSDDVEWLRGAAWAFEQALGLVWYYRTSNPGMHALGRSTIARLLAAPEVTRVG